MSYDTQVKQEAPERIYTHPTSAEYHVNPWPLEPREYVEYIRADLLATVRREAFKEAIAAVPQVGSIFPDGYEEWEGAPEFRERVIEALDRVSKNGGKNG